MHLSGVLCRLFDSHCPHGFCVGSLGSQMLLGVSHPWGVESHCHHGFFVGTSIFAAPVACFIPCFSPSASHFQQLANWGQLFSVAIVVARQSHVP